ncbi:hypothetical protein GCU56_01160 [Geodermatophilus sabuli]|uniref:ARB-07466-like C-terminal domain-containing protein n=1 Tax=Geodermatophilus sabuli TaxID=1564158 RepID=A0A7K3VX16_9ACTN|nr:hypothetical protein [Geodermatophilus sabuli]NEK56484.1 hypothetical protein [Geodermatophilus sabuli]
MAPRTTTSGGSRRAPSSRRRPPAAVRRPALYLGVAVAGAVLVNVAIGVDPTAQAEAGTSESVSVAQQLGLTAQAGPLEATEDPQPLDLQPLEDLTATRSTREAEQTAAQQAQAAADQAERDRLAAEAAAAEAARAAEEAAARKAAEAAAAAEAEAAAVAASRADAAEDTPSRGFDAAPATAAAAPAASVVARINNSAGNVKPVVQAAANAVMSNVAGISSIGGTRASATDPGGHPSGLAADYMCSSSVGDAVVAYHVAHWAELGVDYLIWEQRMLSSPGGSWKPMENRGSPTANHFDHVHVNYRG